MAGGGGGGGVCAKGAEGVNQWQFKDLTRPHPEMVVQCGLYGE